MAYAPPSHGMGSPDSPPSLKDRLRSIFLSCCSGGGRRHGGDEKGHPGAELLRSSTAWVQDRAQKLPEIGERWRTMVASGRGTFGHSSASGGGFKYDPLSYALNFDEGGEDDDEAPLASADDFRRHHALSPSPPRPATVSVPAG